MHIVEPEQADEEGSKPLKCLVQLELIAGVVQLRNTVGTGR